MKTSLICVASLTILTACGGTSGSNSGVQPIVAIPFAALEDTAAELTDKYGEDVLNSNFTSASNLPTSGSANFSGAIGIGAEEVATGGADAQLLGQINVNVDFSGSDNQIQGTASNFHLMSDGSALDGELALDASIVDTTGQMDGNISGTLTQHDPVDFNLGITGGFIGQDAGAIGGSGTGTAYSYDNEETFQVGVVFAAD